jgi:N utilization substance protein B
MTEPPAENPPRAAPRSAARLAAVQALYQMDVAQTDLNEVIGEFCDHRLSSDMDGAEFNEIDLVFFRDILSGIVREQKSIDPLLNDQLAEGWRLSRIDSILRAILRSGAYELQNRADIPAKVIINEYVDVAHAFFTEDEPGVVNGILDQIAKTTRGQEME